MGLPLPTCEAGLDSVCGNVEDVEHCNCCGLWLCKRHRHGKPPEPDPNNWDNECRLIEQVRDRLYSERTMGADEMRDCAEKLRLALEELRPVLEALTDELALHGTTK